jgi:hypothetical protein
MTLQWGDYRAGPDGKQPDSGKHPDSKDTAVSLSSDGIIPGVLSFDGHYIHCGMPMARFGTDMYRVLGDRLLPETLGAYLATRVLRCDCGFQMEIPDQP